jgi:8-oxo-dGTP pyrophosphatase MutT (NUDIX family)
MNQDHVPEFKKVFGAVSVVLFTPTMTDILVCEDYEKGFRGRRRLSLPGGTVDPNDNEDMRKTAFRELAEETGVVLSGEQIIETPFSVPLADGLCKKWFAGICPEEHMALRPTGTFQDVARNGVTRYMQVLGPPYWIGVHELLRLPPKGFCPDDRSYLHYSQVRGVVETIMYLKAAGLDRKHPGFDRLWKEHGNRVSLLRQRMSRD